MPDWLLAPTLKWVVYPLAVWGVVEILVRLARLCHRWWQGRVPAAAFSILVLVRNKGDKIEGLLRTISRMAQSPRPGLVPRDIVVVDHNSSDDTPQIVERLGAELPGLELIRMGELVCRGRSAYEVGMFTCCCRIVVVLDLIGPSDPQVVAQAMSRLVGDGA